MNTPTYQILLRIVTPLAAIGATTDAQAACILFDDFSTAMAVPDQHRGYESRIDTGWNAVFGYGAQNTPSAWDITGGTLQNATTTVPTGSQYTESESPAWIWWTNPLAGNSSNTVIDVNFDYGTAGADTIQAHFWAVQSGGTPTTTNNFITNVQGWANGNSGQNAGTSSGGYTPYNLLDGSNAPVTSSISGALSGTGTSSTSIDVTTLGIPGVNTVGDIDGFFFAIAGNETGGGTASIDNLKIAVPEPSRVTLLGVAALLMMARRRRS